MPRTLPEWIGKTDDAMPPPTVRLRIFEAYNGRCYLCTIRLKPGGWDLDHIKELADGGRNAESNMAPACPACHRKKSAENQSARAEGRRHRMKAAGIRPKRRGFRGYRRFDGSPVWRD